MNKSKLSVTIPEACRREGIPPGSVLIDGTDSVTPASSPRNKKDQSFASVHSTKLLKLMEDVNHRSSVSISDMSVSRDCLKPLANKIRFKKALTARVSTFLGGGSKSNKPITFLMP